MKLFALLGSVDFTLNVKCVDFALNVKCVDFALNVMCVCFALNVKCLSIPYFNLTSHTFSLTASFHTQRSWTTTE